MTWSHSGEFYAFGCAVAWSLAVILFKKTGQSVPPIPLNLFKNTVALVLLAATLPALNIPWNPADVTPTDWWVLLGSGVLGIAIGDTLLFAALNRLGAGRLAIVECLYSPLVIMTAFVYLDEPLGAPVVAAMTLVGGAIVIGTRQRTPPLAGTRAYSQRAGILLGMASMASMAVGIVVAKPILEATDPWWSTTVRLAGAFPVLLVQGLWGRQRRFTTQVFTPGPHWGMLVLASILGTYIALLLWILGFKYTQAGIASVLNQTSSILVMLLAAVFLKEPLTPNKGLAIAMGFSGAILVTLG